MLYLKLIHLIYLKVLSPNIVINYFVNYLKAFKISII